LHLAARLLQRCDRVGMLGAGFLAPYPYDRQDREEIASRAVAALNLVSTDAVGATLRDCCMAGSLDDARPPPHRLRVGIALAVRAGAALWEDAATCPHYDDRCALASVDVSC